jgi:hypothetical protein
MTPIHFKRLINVLLLHAAHCFDDVAESTFRIGKRHHGFAREKAVIRPPRGRPDTMLEVNELLVTFALDIRPDRAILAVLALAGRLP